MSERVRIRKVRMSMKPVACTECGKVSNPLSLYRGFFAEGWFHRGPCLTFADYRAALDLLPTGMFK